MNKNMTNHKNSINDKAKISNFGHLAKIVLTVIFLICEFVGGESKDFDVEYDLYKDKAVYPAAVEVQGINVEPFRLGGRAEENACVNYCSRDTHCHGVVFNR